jgi:hypothetical protein
MEANHRSAELQPRPQPFLPPFGDTLPIAPQTSKTKGMASKSIPKNICGDISTLDASGIAAIQGGRPVQTTRTSGGHTEEPSAPRAKSNVHSIPHCKGEGAGWAG